MHRWTSFLLFLLLISIFHPVSAETSLEQAEKVLSIDLQRGMISTAPLVENEIVVIKSIGHLTALRVSDGNELWLQKHPTQHFFEISPPVFIPADEEGGWPEMIVTGWTDGVVVAYMMDSGEPVWERNTSSVGYGITGSVVIFEDLLIVPFDHGVMAIHIGNGSPAWNIEFDDMTFYRSTPLIVDDRIIIGGETGEVVEIDSVNQSYTRASVPGNFTEPKIRGHIISIGERLLIPVQDAHAGAMVEMNRTEHHLHSASGSLALLAEEDGMVVVATSVNSTLYDCSSWCEAQQVLTEQPVTGEVQFDNGIITLPVNDADGIWLRFSRICEAGICTWQPYPNLAPSHPEYLTAGLGGNDYAIIMVNDAGWVDILLFDILRDDKEYPEEGIKDDCSDCNPFYSINPGLIFLPVGSALILLGVRREGWLRYLPAVGASILLLGGIYYVELIDEVFYSPVESEQSDESEVPLPKQWLGTQVVIFEFNDALPVPYWGNHTFIDGDGVLIESNSDEKKAILVVGGLSGHDDVRSLTIEAAELAGLRYDDHSEILGVRVDRIGEAIDGEGDRWLLFWVNGAIGTFSVDANSIESDALIIWRFE